MAFVGALLGRVPLRSGAIKSSQRNMRASVTSSLRRSERVVQHALDQAGFVKFRYLADLGYVEWRPAAGLRRKNLTSVTAADIERCTFLGRPPGRVVDPAMIALPMSFPVKMPMQKASCMFPYGQLGAVHLHHAIRNCKLDKLSLDFFIGGSALEVLATQFKAAVSRTRAPFLVMKVPGTDVIMLQLFKKFAQDYASSGFQFERLVLGKGIDELHDVRFVEHVQLMELGGFRVLMTADVDGVDGEGDSVEIKLETQVSGKGRRTFFQMLASSSLTLMTGVNTKGPRGVLKAVKTRDLAEIAKGLSAPGRVAHLEENILRGMERLKKFDREGVLEGGKVYQLRFNPDMELRPYPEKNPLLPPEHVLRELLK